MHRSAHTALPGACEGARVHTAIAHHVPPGVEVELSRLWVRRNDDGEIDLQRTEGLAQEDNLFQEGHVGNECPDERFIDLRQMRQNPSID